MHDAATILTWLLRDGRCSPNVEGLLAGLAGALNDAGLPVDRLSFNLRTLHPQIVGRGLTWSRTGIVESRLPREEFTTPRFQASPLRRVFEDGVTIRRRIGVDPEDFPILAELRTNGYTGYLVLPLRFSDGVSQAMTVATRAPGGLSDAAIATLTGLSDAIALTLEVHETRRLASTLLDTYVGRRAGPQVLAGRIHRGAGERIGAALWWCDLRGFTDLGEIVGADGLIPVLNEYFEDAGGAVADQGGEILKFIGDALLAVFPLEGDRDAATNAAFAAAQSALSRLAHRSAGRTTPLRAGIALHVGEVIYGNIGTADRLDFTVIGPAVNLVSRLSGLCGTLGHDLVASEAFAAADPRFTEVGAFPVKGIARPQRVFAPVR